MGEISKEMANTLEAAEKIDTKIISEFVILPNPRKWQTKFKLFSGLDKGKP
jgi:hypothetical protein